MRRARFVLAPSLALVVLGFLVVASPAGAATSPVLHARSATARAILTWSDTTSTAGYLVEQSSDGTHFATLARVTAGTTATSHHLVNGHTYYFVVIAEDRGGGTTASNVVAVTPVGPPARPAHVSATLTGLGTLVSFAVPADGGDPVLAFLVSSAPGNDRCVVTTTAAERRAVPRAGTILSCVVRGLRRGGHYRFNVRARSRAGWSAPSALSGLVRVGVVPGAPSAVSVVPQDSSLVVSWSGVAGGGNPVRRYQVSVSPGNETCSALAPATTCTVSGLTNGVAYVVSVTATNAEGTSAPSSPSAPTTPLPASSVTIGPFSDSSAAINAAMTAQIDQLASDIALLGAQYVVVSAYADTSTPASAIPPLSAAREEAVASALTQALAADSASAVRVVAGPQGTPTSADLSNAVVTFN